MKEEKKKKQVDKKILKLSKTFGIDLVRAAKIHKILNQKGVHSKTMDEESEDEVLKVTPQMANVEKNLIEKIHGEANKSSINFSEQYLIKVAKKIIVPFFQQQNMEKIQNT